MAQINFASKQINCKIVYYGPGLCGKTTNLLNIHDKLPEEKKTEMTSIATEGDRTLFFDFLPLEIGNINGMETKFHLYTVPGQVYYNSTRRLVLQGADGVVFVADSQTSMRDENIESLENLRVNLDEMEQNINDIPLILQYNKRDLKDIMEISALEADLNKYSLQYFEAIACKGEGVYQTLKAISQLVIEYHSQKIVPSSQVRTRPTNSKKKPVENLENKECQSSEPLKNKETIEIVTQQDIKPLTMSSQENNIKDAAIPNETVNADTTNNKTYSNTETVKTDTTNSELVKQYRSSVCSKSGGYMNLAIKQKKKKLNFIQNLIRLFNRKKGKQ